MSDKPEIGKISHATGIAGQHSYSVPVTYPGEDTNVVQFVGNTAGGPIVMITGTGAQTFVTDPERFGEFSPEWVRWYYHSVKTPPATHPPPAAPPVRPGMGGRPHSLPPTLPMRGTRNNTTPEWSASPGRAAHV